MKSRGSTHSDDDANQYMEGGQVNYTHFEPKTRRN
jgi:hypothetical protein